MRWECVLSVWVMIAAGFACTGNITTSDDPIIDPGEGPDAGETTPGDARPQGQPDAAPPDPPDAAPVDPGPLYDQLSADAQGVFDTINEERVAAGLQLVELRDTLVCAAQSHSDDIGPNQVCGHTGTDGSSPGDRVNSCGGGGWTGEIVACGQGTPRSAVDAWLNSPGHRGIMLDGSKREIGVAVVNNYWTAIFDN